MVIIGSHLYLFSEKVEEITQFNLSDAKHRHFVQIYREKLFHLHHIEGIYVELMLTQVPLNTYGVPVVILERHGGNKWNPRLLTYTLVDIFKGLYRIKFTQTCNCQFTIQLRQRGDVANNDSITIEVKHQSLHEYREFLVKSFNPSSQDIT